MKIGQQIATDDECAEKQEIQSILDDKVISDWENIEVSASEVTEMMREFLGLIGEGYKQSIPDAEEEEEEEDGDWKRLWLTLTGLRTAYRMNGVPSKLEESLMETVLMQLRALGRAAVTCEELQTETRTQQQELEIAAVAFKKLQTKMSTQQQALERAAVEIEKLKTETRMPPNTATTSTQVQEDDSTQDETVTIVEEEAKTVAEIKESEVEPTDEGIEDSKPVILEILIEDEPTVHAVPAKEVYKPPQRRKNEGSQQPESSSSSSSTSQDAKKKKKHQTNRRSDLTKQQQEDRSQGSRSSRCSSSSSRRYSESNRSWRRNQEGHTDGRRCNRDDRYRRFNDSDGYRSGSDNDRSRHNSNRSRYSSMSDDRSYRSSNRSYSGRYYAEGSQGRRNRYDRRCRGYSTETYTTQRRGDWRYDADGWRMHDEEKLKQYLYKVIQYVVDAL